MCRFGNGRPGLRCLRRSGVLEGLQRKESAGSESVVFIFPEQQFPPESTSNEHGCWKAPSQRKRRHCLARPALRMHPSNSPLPHPIHHTQNASHWPSSSPAGRRKIDLFVYRGKGSEGVRRSSRKGKDRGESRGRLIPRCVCVPKTDTTGQSDEQIDKLTDDVFTLL